MTKVKTVRFDDDSPLGKWADNQEDFSKSVRKAIDFVVKRYGTGDLFDAIVDDAIGNRKMGEANRVKESQNETYNESDKEPEEPEKTVNENEVDESLKDEEKKPVARPKSGLREKVQKNQRKEDNKNSEERNSDKKKIRNKVDLGMLSDF